MSGSKENKQEALQKENEYKVTWKGWVSLAFLIISFSGLVAHQDNFLKAFDFHQLNPEKNWHDVTVSHQSLKEGFKNYLFTTLPVLHQPHGSRPWKQLKYKNRLKYYWLTYRMGLEKC